MARKKPAEPKYEVELLLGHKNLRGTTFGMQWNTASSIPPSRARRCSTVS